MINNYNRKLIIISIKLIIRFERTNFIESVFGDLTQSGFVIKSTTIIESNQTIIPRPIIHYPSKMYYYPLVFHNSYY